MEKKKLDLNSIIGFVLIFGIMIWIMYQNKPTQAEIDKKAKEELVEKVRPLLPSESFDDSVHSPISHSY